MNAPSDDKRPPRGRYAPSPTGLLHVGNARTALVAWLSVRSRGGAFVWRVEDLDPPRVIAGAAEAAIRDLAWLGLDWDEGPDRGGAFAPYVQSERGAFYEEALQLLHDRGRLFPCSRSRRELASISSAPHPGEDEAPYPAALRPTSLSADWYQQFQQDGGASLRFRVNDETLDFDDLMQGPLRQATGGDFVLKRRDGLYAYQLAVVVDDWRMGIDEVVRGSDLLGSTARQVQLMDALGAPRPVHAHVPMVLTADGEKLSKRDDAITLRSLREAGVAPEQLVGWLAWSLGLLDRPRSASPGELVAAFAWSRIGKTDCALPRNFTKQVQSLSP